MDNTGQNLNSLFFISIDGLLMDFAILFFYVCFLCFYSCHTLLLLLALLCLSLVWSGLVCPLMVGQCQLSVAAIDSIEFLCELSRKSPSRLKREKRILCCFVRSFKSSRVRITIRWRPIDWATIFANHLSLIIFFYYYYIIRN